MLSQVLINGQEKFSSTDWNFSDEERTSSIKAAKDENDRTLIFVSQMYSRVLTRRRNEAMKKRKELKKEDIQGIQAYVKYLAVLMVKRLREAAYTPYAKYYFKLILKD